MELFCEVLVLVATQTPTTRHWGAAPAQESAVVRSWGAARDATASASSQSHHSS